MIWKIAKKEISNHLLSFRFTVAALLCVLAILTSSVAMYRQYERRAQDYALTQARQGESIVSIPPRLTSMFAWGLEDVTGRTVDLRQFPFVMTLGLQSPLNLFDRFFPTFDPSYVVRVVGALLAMGFAFDAICGEGRAGTLALMLANGASRRSILAGKLLGGFAVLATLFIFPVLFGLTILSVLFSAPLTLDALARILLWSGGSALYLLCFFCLGLLVSSIFRLPKLSLMVCLVLWTVLIFVAPSVVTSLARVGTHLQSPVRFEQQNLLSSMPIMKHSDRKARIEEARRQLQKREARANEVLAFSGLTLTALRVFPGAAYVDLSANLAGTGVLDMSRYYVAIQRYMGDVVAAREQRIGAPAFAFVRSDLGTCVQSAIPDVVGLVVWCAVSLWLAVVALSRYDVRTLEAREI